MGVKAGGIYTIQVDLSDKNIRSQVEAMLGDIGKQVSNNAIELKLNWDPKSLSSLYKKADEILKNFPEVGIQIKYELDKKILADMKESYNSIFEMKDADRAVKRTEEIFNQLKVLKQSIVGMDSNLIPKDTVKQIDQLEESLVRMSYTLAEMSTPAKTGGNGDLFGKLSAEVQDEITKIEDKYYDAGKEVQAFQVILQDTKGAKEQSAELRELEKSMSMVEKDMRSLKKQGAVDLSSVIDEHTKESKLREEIEAIKQALVDLKSKAEQNISLQVQIKDAVDAINKVEDMLNALPNPKTIGIQLTGLDAFEQAVEKARESAEAVLGNITLGSVKASKSSTIVQGGAVLTDKQIAANDQKLKGYVNTLKEQNDLLEKPSYSKQAEQYIKVANAIDVEKKKASELTEIIKEQADAYKQMLSSRRTKKATDYINANGESVNGIPSLDDIKARRAILAGYLAEYEKITKGSKDPFALLGKTAKNDLAAITTAFNEYKNGASSYKKENERIQQINQTTVKSINSLRSNIEKSVKLSTGNLFDKKGLYEILDKFQSGELTIQKTIKAIDDLKKASSTSNASTVQNKEVIVEAQNELQGELEETKEKEVEIEQVSSEAGQVMTDALEKTSEASTKTKRSIDELTESIRELAKERASVGALDSPLSGWGKSKGGFKSLAKMTKSTEDENYEVAKSILDNAKLFKTNGDVDLLKTIKEDAKKLTGEKSKNLQTYITREVNDYIKKLSKGIDDTVEEAVKTKMVTMSKKEYQKYWEKNNSIFKNSENLQHNFEKHFDSLVSKGLATQSVSESGKKGRWTVQVEIELTNKDQVEAEFAKIKETVKTLGNLDLRDKGNRESLSKIVEEFRSYQSAGGTKSLNDLTNNAKMLAKLTTEYEKQTKAINDKTTAQEQSTKATEKATAAEKNLSVAKEKEASTAPSVKVNVEPVVDAQAFADKVTSLLSEVSALIKVLPDDRGGDASDSIEQLKTLASTIDSVNKSFKGKSGLNAVIKELSGKKSEKLKNLLDNLNKIRDTLNKNLGKNSLGQALKDIANQSDGLKKILRDLQKVQQELSKESAAKTVEKQVSPEVKKDIKTFQNLIDAMKIDGKAGLLGSSFTELEEEFAKFETDLSTLSTSEAQGQIEALITKAKSLRQEAVEIKREMNSLANENSINALKARVETLLTFYKKLSSTTISEANKIKDSLTPGITKTELQELSTQFGVLYNRAKAAGELGITFGDRWRKGLQSLSRYLLTFASFYRVIGYVQESLTTIKELDDALIDLRKTTTMTNDQLEEFYRNSSNVGKQVGTTAQEIISQAAAWSRLGYQTKEEATAMAELSAQFAAISPGMTLDKATDGLVSTMKAFHIDVENVERDVMDSINRIGNTMATSNEEVVEMLTRSSAAMNAANNSLAETIALESAAVQITRNAETTGTAFRTISMRIRGLDEETEEAMEDFDILQGKIADLTKTADKPSGISLFKDKDKTTYKSTYELLKDISVIYHDLTDKQQAGLLEALAGKRGGQVLAGILDDFSEVEKAMGEIEKSAGSADAEMQIIRESISYQLNALKQTWVGFLQDLIDRGTIKELLENLTLLSEKLIELAENNPVGTAGGIALLATALKALFAGNLISKIRVAVQDIGSFISFLSGTEELRLGTAFFNDLAIGMDRVAKESDIVVDALDPVIRDLQPTNLERIGIALKGSLVAPFTLAAAAVTAFVIAAKATQAANEGLRKSAERLGQEYLDNTKDIDSYKEEVQNLQETLSDSSISYEDAKTARERLLTIQDELIEKYGDEKTAINDITEAVDGSVEAFDRLSDRQWQEALNEFNSDDGGHPVGAWFNKLIHGADDNVKIMLDQMEDVSRTVIGTTGDFEELADAAQKFNDVTYFSDGVTGELTIAADSAYDLKEKLLDVQEYLKKSGASKGLISDIGKQITDLEDLISEYDSFYNQFVLNERIFGSDYEDDWFKWQKEYEEYQKAVIDGNKTIEKSTEQGLVQALDEIRDRLKEQVDNGEISDAYAQSILNSFRNTIPELQSAFAEADLRAALFIEPELDEAELEEVTNEVIKTVEDEIEGSDYEKSVIGKGLEVETTTPVSIVPNLKDTKDTVDSIVPSLNDVRDAVDEVDEAVLGVQRETEEAGSIATSELLLASLHSHDYVESLNDIYKAYNGINNIDRDIIFWDDKSLEENRQFVEEIYGTFEEGAEKLKGSWSTVLGTAENIDGIEIAYTQMLQTDHGLVPLTRDEFWNYFDEIFEQAWDGDAFDADKFIQLDAEGADRIINGQVEHVANMIAAAEGQHMGKIVLTADDVIAIGAPGYDDEGNDLMPDNHSIFKGFSMHDVQAQALEYKAVLAEVGDEAKKTAQDVEKTYKEINQYELPKRQERPEDKLTEKGKDILNATKAFNDAQELLSMANKNNFNAATEDQQKAYEYLQNEADYYGVSIQQLIDMLHEAQALDKGFMYGRSDRLANAYGQARGIDISNDSRKQDYNIITSAVNALSESDYQTALQFTDSIWKNVEERAKELISDTDTNTQRAEKYKQIIEQVADEWRDAEEAAQHVTPDPMSISQTVDSINEKLKPSLDALGEVYTEVLSAPNTLIAGSLGKIDLIEQVEKIKTELDELNSIEGIEVDYSSFEHLVEVLQDTTSTGEEVQDAFNGVATSITTAGIKGTESIETLISALSDFGITNAPVVAIGQLIDSTDELAAAGLDLANADEDVIEAWAREVSGAEDATQAINLLKMQKILLNQNALNEEESITELLRLAKMAGVATDAIRELLQLQSDIGAAGARLTEAVKSGQTSQINEATAALGALNDRVRLVKASITNDITDAITASYTSPAGTSAAGGAGKEAGDAYVDAFEKELEKLKGAYDRGEISLKEYLDRWKALIQQFFANNPKYAEEYANQMKAYLDSVKGYYDSAISGVTTLIDYRIKAVQKQKDAAIKALEEERDAALKVYDDQIKAIDKTIKAKQKQIKALEKAKKAVQDEIDKIRKANEERQREIDLQKDFYELERLQNQRTQFIYKDGQMVYQTDPSAIRDAREKVKQDEDEKKIAELEKQIEAYDKQIELINEEIESLEEQKELLEEQRAAVEEFYNKLIEDTQKYFDELIEALEKQKSKWEELAEVEKITSAWKDVGEVMEMFGYTIEDVLNDTPGAFETFKDAYLQMCLDVDNGNKFTMQGIQEWANLTGQSANVAAGAMSQAASDINGSTDEIADGLDKAKESADKTADSLSNVGSSTSGYGGAASDVNAVGDASEATAGKVDDLTQKTEKLEESANDATTLKSAFDELQGINLDNIMSQLEALRQKLTEIKTAIGLVETGSNGEQALGGLGSLTGALQSLNDISLEGVIAQFTSLKGAIDGVVAALGGGEGGAPATNGGVPGTGAQSAGNMGQMTGGEEGGGSGLTGAIKAVKTAADTYIGTGGGEEDSGEGGGTAISDFEALGSAVNDVTAAIGGGGEGSSASGSFVGNTNAQVDAMQNAGGGGGTLIGAVTSFGETDAAIMGEAAEGGEGVLGRWADFLGEVTQTGAAVDALKSSIENLPETKEVTISVHLDIDEGKYTGTAIRGNKRGHFQLDIPNTLGIPSSESFISKLKGSGKAHLSGTALLNGDWAYEGGKTLIAEIGPELVVYPNGTYRTFDKPQMVNLPRGAVIFNHKQTEEILDTRNQVPSLFGKSNANGTLPNGLVPLSQSNPEAFNTLVQNAELLRVNTEDMKTDLSNIGYATDDIKRAVQNITNNTNMGTTITFGDLQFTCTGITSAEVLNEVGNALQREFQGLTLNAYQRAVNMA